MKRFAVLVVLTVFTSTSWAQVRMADARAEWAAARAAEKKQDWDSALLHYENLFDSTKTDDSDRSKIRGKFLEIRPKVSANADRAKAGVWKVRAYAFRSFDVTWKGKDGKQHVGKHRFRDDEIESIRVAMRAFSEIVWKHSQGNLRIEWQLKVIDQPLRSFPGWPDPGSCMPFFTDLKAGETDSIFVFSKSFRTDQDKDDKTENAEWGLWAGTFGVLPETKGATYIGFNNPGPASGILQFHEWLHAAQWCMEDYQGYPRGLMITSDCGGNCGTIDGKPCYSGPRPDPKEEWMPLYTHLMDAHATRQMWRRLSVTKRPTNCWIDQYCRTALAIGPFSAGGKPDYGLNEPFIDENSMDASPGKKIAGKEWRILNAAGRNIDLAAAFGTDADQVAYLLVKVDARREQLAQVRLGTDDGCKLWHNGRVILFAPVERGAQADANIVDVKLARGVNTFLLKVSNRAGGWEAILRIGDSQGNPIPGVRYVAPANAQ